MHTSRISRRRVGAALIGLCLTAGAIGNAALASSTNSATTVSIEANVLVQAGMRPVGARQAAQKLNVAIDSAAQTLVRSAATALPSRRPVRNTAAATRAFATEIDAALTDFVIQSISGLQTAGAGTEGMVAGTLAALANIVRSVPGAVAVTVGAEIAVAGGTGGTTATASITPTLDPALRQTISATVLAVRPVVPMTVATVRTVAAGVRQVVDASVAAVNEILDATVEFTVTVLGVTGAAVAAVTQIADSAVASANTIVAAVDETLDNLSDVNITAAVDASLGLTVH